MTYVNSIPDFLSIFKRQIGDGRARVSLFGHLLAPSNSSFGQYARLTGPTLPLHVNIPLHKRVPVAAYIYRGLHEGVLGICKGFQVLWVAASGIITLMVNDHSAGDGSKVNDKRESVGGINDGLLVADSAVAEPILGARPIPAPGSLILVNIGKQLRLQFLCNNHFMNTSHIPNVAQGVHPSMKIDWGMR